MSEKQLPSLGSTYMNLPQAQRLAQATANDTNMPVLVYKSKLHEDFDDYDVAFTLPSFGVRIGDPIQPIKKVVEPLLELNTLKGSSGDSSHLAGAA